MKSTKVILTVLGAAAAMNIAALAEDLKLETLQNSHGQVTMQYRSTEPTIALFAGNRGVGQTTTSSNGELKLESKDNGHGQAILMYRAD